MKIFNNNLKNNSKTIVLRKKLGDEGKIKYLPSFSKEWKNIIYCYNKNNLKNIPVNNININKIIKSYFNLYFKEFSSSEEKRHNFLRRIYVSNAEIKHTNNKAKITLYTVNRENLKLKKKYLKINKKVSKYIIKRFILLLKKTWQKRIIQIKEVSRGFSSLAGFSSFSFLKKILLNYKLKLFNKSLWLQNIYMKKIWSVIISSYWKSHIKILRKYDLMYSLNKYKFNKQKFLPILSGVLNKIIRKKIEYNIINLKSITYNTDLFTHVLALKIKRKKIGDMVRTLLSILNRASLPWNLHDRRVKVVQDHSPLSSPHKYKDLKLISILNKGWFDKLLSDYSSNTKEIHKTIYNSIGYKNMRGIRLEVKGRLTKRYRADRSKFTLKLKGGLKNVESSFKGLSSVLFRGNSNSNVSYSVHSSKRYIGAFAVKGWIAGV